MLSVSTRPPVCGACDGLPAEATLAVTARLGLRGLRIFDLEFAAIFYIPVGFPTALAPTILTRPSADDSGFRNRDSPRLLFSEALSRYRLWRVFSTNREYDFRLGYFSRYYKDWTLKRGCQRCPGRLPDFAATALTRDASASVRSIASTNMSAPTRKNSPTSSTSIPTSASTAAPASPNVLGRRFSRSRQSPTSSRTTSPSTTRC